MLFILTYYLKERDRVEQSDVDAGELLEEEQPEEDYDWFVSGGLEELLQFH